MLAKMEELEWGRNIPFNDAEMKCKFFIDQKFSPILECWGRRRL
jgi:hypothetical protein